MVARAGGKRGGGARWRRWLRSGAQWGAGLLILWLLFRNVPFAEAIEAARRADMVSLVSLSLLVSLVWFLLDSAALSYLFTRFHVPFSQREARSIRALSYLVAMVNWNLGSGAIILHLRRAKNVPLTASLATMLFYNSLDGFILLGMSVLGFATAGAGRFAATVGVALAALLALILAIRSERPDWEPLNRLRAAVVLRTIRSATAVDFAIGGVVRLIYFLIFVLYFWAGLKIFSVDASLLYMMGTVPMVLLSGVLPITPAGLGTQQAAMLYLLRPYGDEANILAFGLAFPVIVMLARLPLSLFYLPDLNALRRTLDEAESPR